LALRARAGLVVTGLGTLIVLTPLAGVLRHRHARATRLTVRPTKIVADGYDSATLSIESTGAVAPVVSLTGNVHSATAGPVSRAGANWEVRIRAGVLPEKVRLRVALAGVPTAEAELEILPFARDMAADGTPDFLRLEDDRDQQAFRHWFTWLAEVQYFQPSVARPVEINDCAALIRYAYREALHAQDSAWAATARIPLAPAFPSVAKYQYPFTPLGAALFRTREGPFDASSLTDGSFAQFADVRTLWRFNTHLVGRVLSAALPGDLLFFHQDTGMGRFHSMIYLGESQIHNNGRSYILYHTGPSGADPGEIRRLNVEELMSFPRAEWRPLAANPGFLGVFRWNILRKEIDTPRE